VLGDVEETRLDRQVATGGRDGAGHQQPGTDRRPVAEVDVVDAGAAALIDERRRVEDAEQSRQVRSRPASP
jgi:hypothetical protein